MSDNKKKIEQLEQRLDQLAGYQSQFSAEIRNLRTEINSLKAAGFWQTKPSEGTEAEPPKTPETQYTSPFERTSSPPPVRPTGQTEQNKSQPSYASRSAENETAEAKRSNLEKFIGENLISKIGIVILVIGVAIGAKYAIDNNLISPLTRIILGYACGITLVALAVRLRQKYLNFSAVLLSGGMAIMYFITFFAYSLYSLINQPTAFVLMVIFTVFTVASSVQYNRQIIAHIGLVGAYAVPFLLSNDSGNYLVLFGYVALINLGILAVSVRKYWKSLFYSSFVITWLIYNGWYASRYVPEEHFYLGMTFAALFFLIFYVTFLAYKLVSKENLAIENVGLILTNSFIFYGFGYAILKRQAGFENLLGVFTIINAAIHLAFAYGISRLKLGSKDLVYLTAALVLTFVTITVPIEAEGNFVTLVWAAEAAVLFWIGRTKEIQLFEWFSYPLMTLASISLLVDWGASGWRYLEKNEVLFPFWNRYFAVGLFFVIAFAFIWYLTRDKNLESALPEQLVKPVNFIITAVLLIALYHLFRAEIGNYYSYQAAQMALLSDYNWQASRPETNFSVIWQLNYTMLFLTALSFVNISRFKSAFLGFINLGLNALTAFIFLTLGLVVLGELRMFYLQAADSIGASQGVFNLVIRYISYCFFALICYASFRYIKQEFLIKYIPAPVLKILFDMALHVSVLVVLSVELINWMDIFTITGSFELGLSILWGLYAVFLIVLGIVFNEIHLRIMAITLFAATLFKLFIYDIADLDTISKTVVFVSLGVLLLTISFLYTKYRHLIFEKDALKEDTEKPG